jgi:hypothetical protein
MSAAKRYPFQRATISSPIKICVLETMPKKVLTATKRYEDRTLTLHVVDDIIIEKFMTCSVPWDYEGMLTEKGTGAKVSFKWYEKDGYEVDLTYFGSFLVAKMFILTEKCKVALPHLFAADWHEELESDYYFPLLDIKMIDLQDGWSATQMDNPGMVECWHADIVSELFSYQHQKLDTTVVYEEEMARSPNSSVACEHCRQMPCIWIRNMEAVRAAVENMHEGDNTAFSIGREFAFNHMNQIVQFPGKEGENEGHSECVSLGVMALFPEN